MTHRLRKMVLIFLASSLASGRMARAQAETGFQFNLSTPGARSLGMGGAFLGLADDATAAYTNPAGLTNLTIGGPEVTVEVRHWDYSTRFIERGHLLGSPRGEGLDTVAGLESMEAASGTRGPSFISFGYILPHGVTIALYRHQLAKFQTDFVRQGVFLLNPEVDRIRFCDNHPPNQLLLFNDCRFPPSQVHHELEIANTGISAARHIEWTALNRRGQSLSIGFGISYYQLEQHSRSDLLYFNSPSDDPLVNRSSRGFLGPADLLDDNVALSTRVDGTDEAFGISLGFLWSLDAKSRWTLGGVYREGPEFAVPSRSFWGPAYDRFYPGLYPVGAEFASGLATLHLPDTYGLGLAYSSKEGKFKVALDVNRVRYSQRLNDLVNSADAHNYELDDIDEVHLGVEGVLLEVEPHFIFTLRLGAWNEPAHEPVYHGPITGGSALYPQGKDSLHWAGGIGLVIKEDFQIDSAVDVSDLGRTLSLSVVRFF